MFCNHPDKRRRDLTDSFNTICHKHLACWFVMQLKEWIYLFAKDKLEYLFILRIHYCDDRFVFSRWKREVGERPFSIVDDDCCVGTWLDESRKSWVYEFKFILKLLLVTVEIILNVAIVSCLVTQQQFWIAQNFEWFDMELKRIFRNSWLFKVLKTHDNRLQLPFKFATKTHRSIRFLTNFIHEAIRIYTSFSRWTALNLRKEISFIRSDKEEFLD
jgi:hypothetical protein